MASSPDEAISMAGTGGITIAADDSIHSLTVRKTCAALFRRNQFVDVTLSCKDGQLHAHRLILSSASPYLYNLFTSTSAQPTTPCTQPIIILRNCYVTDVQSALEFIYSGKTRIAKSKLQALLEVGHELGCNLLKKAVQMANVEAAQDVKPKYASASSPNIEIRQGAGQFQGEDYNSQIAKVNRKRANEANSALTNIPKLLRMANGGTPSNLDRDRIYRGSNQDHRQHPRQDLTWMTGSMSMNSAKDAQSTSSNKASEGRISLLKNSASTASSNMTSLNLAKDLLLNSGVTIQQTPSPPLPASRLNLQHDKSERFLYTNENLGMTVKKEKDDENESEDPDESEEELKTSLPMSHLPQISVKPVKNTGAGNQDLPRFELIKTESQPWKFGSPEQEGDVSCPLCMQIFQTAESLHNHIKTHVTPNGNYKAYTCEYCQHEFGRSAHLKRHLRTHTGEKPYECEICHRVFSRQDKMKVHMKSHMNAMGNNNLNPNNNSNKSMTITSYPPVSMSQSSAGQVPIKILLPTGHSGKRSSNSMKGSVSTEKQELGKIKLEDQMSFSHSPIGSPSNFFSDSPGPSITIDANPPDTKIQMPTLAHQNRPKKSMNFLVN